MLVTFVPDRKKSLLSTYQMKCEQSEPRIPHIAALSALCDGDRFVASLNALAGSCHLSHVTTWHTCDMQPLWCYAYKKRFTGFANIDRHGVFDKIYVFENI